LTPSEGVSVRDGGIEGGRRVREGGRE
jgi:hypothetical protein